MAIKPKKKRNCTKGYSCGYGCISVKLQCRTDGLQGQSVKLAEDYFKRASGKASEPDYTNLKDEDSIGAGAFGRTWLVGDKIVKRYHASNGLNDGTMEEFNYSNDLANKTLAKDGVMPKVTKLPFKGEDGNWYSEQEALIGYKTMEELSDEGFKANNDYSSLMDKIQTSLDKWNVSHGDLHPGNAMVKVDEEGNVIDIKLIDGDLVSQRDTYDDPKKAAYAESVELLGIWGTI